MEEFNVRGNGVEVLVISFRLSNLEVNMQNDCSDVIFFDQ